MATRTYFLGGNTAEGFASCYEHFCPAEAGNFLWVIKGGPGCGKSSFMRKIGRHAEEIGLDVEYVLCSGDPDSLDGVYIPALNLGYVDGTAPHILDPKYPAISGAYHDLGQFYDMDALRGNASVIRSIYNQYKECYAAAYTLLATKQQSVQISAENFKRRRFMSAITCKGIVHLPTEPMDADALQHLASAPSVYTCILHPLWQKQAIGIVKNGTAYAIPLEIPNCDDAIAHLREAKALHDELERLYNPHVNFDEIYKLADKHIQKYL